MRLEKRRFRALSSVIRGVALLDCFSPEMKKDERIYLLEFCTATVLTNNIMFVSSFFITVVTARYTLVTFFPVVRVILFAMVSIFVFVSLRCSVGKKDWPVSCSSTHSVLIFISASTGHPGTIPALCQLVFLDCGCDYGNRVLY